MSKLIIGNKNYSSWSLRPWILLKETGIAFEEQRIPLHTETTRSTVLQLSPAGKVPIYIDNGLTIWDSLAICEYINDKYPDKHCWPTDMQDRARARAISNEMHSGFPTIRNTLFMSCRTRIVYTNISPKLEEELERVRQIWRDCRSRNPDGPFLFGRFTIADAMYAPMVCRFLAYGIKVGAAEQAYMDAMLALPSLKQWMQDGAAETEVLSKYEVVQP